MTSENTYIKLCRKILSWRWYKNANTSRLFIHLLLKANVYDRDFEKIKVLRGQTVTSRKALSQELGMSQKQVMTAIEHLKGTGEITTHSTSKYTLITVVNYDFYQSEIYIPGSPKGQVKGQQTDNDGTTKEQQRGIKGTQINNKNNNNKNNNKNNNNKYAKFKDDYCLESSFDADEFFKVAVEHSKRMQKQQFEEENLMIEKV